MAEPFRSNLFQHAPSRVSSEPQPPPTSKKSHLHSLHHHAHRHHHHHRHSSRHHAKEAVQSAIQLHPPTSFGDLLKQAKGSSSNTPSESRRQSVRYGDKDDNGTSKRSSMVENLEREARKPVRLEDVERERKRVKAREEELLSSLQSLSDQSLKTSRRLDDTYYSILEKVSLLRQTIGSLQELSGLTKELHDNFQSDTKQLTEDIRGQFEGFDNFESQKNQVTALEARIKVGREKADALNARLVEAKKHVDARAKSEADLEARNTRRIRILWGIHGAIAALVIISILFQQLRPIHADTLRKKGLDFASREQILDAPIPDIAKEAIMQSSKPRPQVQIEIPARKPVTELEDDHRLRMFDEL